MTQLVITGFLGTAAYLVGSIPSGVVVGRLVTGQDVRHSGSGNIGAANVSRVAGLRPAMVVLLVDVAKGFAPVYVASTLGLSSIETAIIAGIAVLGHDFSIFLRLRGGKGVATTLGVCLGLALTPTLVVAVAWLGVVAATRISSLASLCALWLLPVLFAAFDAPTPYTMLALSLGILGFVTHRENLRRLSRGEERRIGKAAAGTSQ